MGNMIGKNFKYKKINNFINQNEIDLIKNYTIFKHRKNITNFDFIQNNVGDTYFHGDPLTDSLLLSKLKLMEEICEKKLHPTYSFWRMYTMFSDLKKHMDRAACEISVTVMIGSDGTEWPIYIEGEKITLLPGEAVIYLGCELEHWREEFKGDWHSQVFLHYVDANGPNANHKYDNRNFLGE
jgi:hypothetical protein